MSEDDYKRIYMTLIKNVGMELAEWHRMTPADQMKRANEIIEQRHHWCKETLDSNRWIRFRHELCMWPILGYAFGKHVYAYYEEHYPERVQEVRVATGVVMAGPISQRIGYEDIGKQAIIVRPLEGDDNE
jgi:hypothetical protein